MTNGRGTMAKSSQFLPETDELNNSTTHNKYKYIVHSTMKENIKAIIPFTPKMTMLMERIKSHMLADPVEFEE